MFLMVAKAFIYLLIQLSIYLCIYLFSVCYSRSFSILYVSCWFDLKYFFLHIVVHSFFVFLRWNSSIKHIIHQLIIFFVIYYSFIYRFTFIYNFNACISFCLHYLPKLKSAACILTSNYFILFTTTYFSLLFCIYALNNDVRLICYSISS